MLNAQETQLESLYSHALEAVAQGVDRPMVNTYAATHFRNIPVGTVIRVLDEALDGARSCGIEVEDIDPSWLY